MQRERNPAPTDGAGIAPVLAPGPTSGFLTPFVEPEVLAARERFATTCEQAPIGIAHQTLDGRWLWVNQRFCEVLGWPRGELLATTLERISHPDDLAANGEFAESVRAGSRAEYTIERRYVRKDSGVVWASRTVSLVRDGFGQPAYLVSFLHDVTDRKRVESDLRDSETRYRQLNQAALEGIFIHERGTIVDANPAFQRMLGYELEELRGKNVFSLLASAETRTLVERYVAEGRTDPYEVQVRRRDGETITAEITGRPTVCFGREMRVVVTRDITARKRAELQAVELARESEARAAAERAGRRAAFLAEASRLLGASFDYQTTLATLARLSVPEMADFCMVDVVEADDTVKRIGLAHVDPAGEEILRGLAAYAQVDRHLGPFHPVFEGEALFLADVRDELLTLGASDEEQLRLRRQLAPRSCISVPLTSSNRVLGVLTLVHSVSGRRYEQDDLDFAATIARRAALAIENARLFDAAQRATRARDEMLGIVAHDLRNPLGTIHLAAQFLEELVPADQSIARKQLAPLRRARDRMKRLIDDLLDVKRVEAGTLTVTPRPEPVAGLVEDAVSMLDPLAAAAGLVTEWSVEPDLPPALVDPQRIQQTISNLVGNAIKFTPRGGTIALRARRASDGICFEVADSGPGIPPDELPHIFGRFWQGDRGDRRGIGLGLAIARAIVEAHKGRIWVESRVGEGSRFYFTTPAAR
ncbi:MAG: PAS domain S-box protein [Gemmatimonadaceae bacterium]|nr:PAS domain S-box protein [Gemmatimonadaceae bacterium]